MAFLGGGLKQGAISGADVLRVDSSGNSLQTGERGEVALQERVNTEEGVGRLVFDRIGEVWEEEVLFSGEADGEQVIDFGLALCPVQVVLAASALKCQVALLLCRIRSRSFYRDVG